MKPFEVYSDCGTAAPVRFTLNEERIRKSGNVKVKLALADNSGSPDDRTRLWRAALEIARGVLDRNIKGPIEVYDGADVWIIPEGTVKTVRLHDPEDAKGGRREIGFRIEGGEEPETG